MPSLNRDNQKILLDYQEQLAFIQSELSTDRGRLFQAKKQNESPELIQSIETDIQMLEAGIDKTQDWIQKLKQNQTSENHAD
jgi:cob(I)alamin adenosyltransferase